MKIFDIETAPDEKAIQSRQWSEYKEKKGVKDDQEAALHPAFGRVVCICAYDEEIKQKFKMCSSDERNILYHFAIFINPGDILAGHYIKGFDIPFLANRYMANDLEIPTVLNCSGKKPWEIPHLDTVEILKFGGNIHMSLDATCLMLGLQSPKEGKINASGVWDAFKENRFEDIIEYCSSDVRETIGLIGKLRKWEAIR